MTPVWFVYHIPKTGGQTIRDQIALQLDRGVEYLHLGKWDRESALGVDDVAALDPAEREKIRVLSGHPVERAMIDLFPGRPVREVVIVREPAARMVSHYNFNMTMRARQGEPTIGLEEYLDSTRENHMTGHLAKRFGFDRVDRLDEVLHELSQAWLVGRTESLDALLPGLLAAMGLSPPEATRSNVTGVHIDRWASLTPDLADEIRRRNPLDVMLHAAAGRFERRTEARLESVRRRSVRV